MAATVGELVVNLTARTAKFNRGMASSGRNVKQFAAKSQSASRMIGKLGATLAGVFAGGKIIAWFKQGVAEIDRMAKVSAKLGFTVDQLNAMHQAGKLAGIGISTVDMAIQRMTRRAAEAAIGTGEAQAAIKELGLDAVKLSADGPWKAMLKIADAMTQVKSPADRLRLAFKLFDSEGAELVNLMDEGAAGLQKIKAEMDALGGVSQLGAQNVEKFNDQLTRMGAIVTEGGRNRLIQSIAGISRELGGPEGAFAQSTGFEKVLAVTPIGMGLMLQKMMQAKQATADIVKLQQDAAKAASDTFKQQQELRRLEAGASGEKMLEKAATAFNLRNVSDAEKRIRLWVQEAKAAEVTAEKISAIANRLRSVAKAQALWENEKEAASKREAAAASKMNTVRQIIGQQLQGGDGAALRLPGTAPLDSAAAYSAIVRRGLQGTGAQTDKQILEFTKRTVGRLKEIDDNTERLVKEFKNMREVNF